MMMAWHGRWTATLLVGALAGCPAPADDDDGADESSTGDPTTGGVTTTTTGTDPTTGEPATDSGSTAAVDTGTDSGTTSEDTDGTTGDTTGDTTGGTTGDTTGDTTAASTGGTEGSSSSGGNSGEEDCAAQCGVVFMCTKGIWETEQDCTDSCVANLEKAGAFSPFCEQAWQSLAVCLGTLTCEEYMQWQAPMEIPYPCLDEDDALAFECEGQ